MWQGSHLADGCHHILVFLPAEKFLDAEVKLLQQQFVGRQPERRPEPGQQPTQLISDVGDRVVDQLQSRDQKVFVEVFPGEDLGGCFTNVKEPEAVPVAPPLSQT